MPYAFKNWEKGNFCRNRGRGGLIMSNRNKGKKRVKFQLTAKDAEYACLVGDFNGWDPEKHPMRKNADGVWEKVAMLAPGRYEYKFQVDGKWRIDTRNTERCRNKFGTENCILNVHRAK